MKISDLYDNRFGEREKERKNELWRVLCASFFQRYIPEDAIVLDVGAGFCEFINNITCKEKYAVDLNKNISSYADPEVHATQGALSDFISTHCNYFDIVFMSNFLEHLKSKDDVLQVLADAYSLLKDQGRILVLQPNIKYLYKEYWDFLDHHIAISDRSLIEALELSGFTIELIFPRFLPYTTKSRIPQHPALVKAYLKIPLAWKVFGKQAFAMGKKNV